MWMAGVTADAVCLINIIAPRVGQHRHLDRNQRVRLSVDLLSWGRVLWKQSVKRQNKNKVSLLAKGWRRTRREGRGKNHLSTPFTKYLRRIQLRRWDFEVKVAEWLLSLETCRSPVSCRFYPELNWSHLYSGQGSSKRSVGDPLGKPEFPFEDLECKYLKPIKLHGSISQTAGYAGRYCLPAKLEWRGFH